MKRRHMDTFSECQRQLMVLDSVITDPSTGRVFNNNQNHFSYLMDPLVYGVIEYEEHNNN